MSENAATSEIQYRWVNGGDCADADWADVETLLLAKGYGGFARGTTTVLFAFRGGTLAGFMVFRLFPQVGPAYVEPSERGTGVAAEMAEVMMAFLNHLGVSFLAIAESKHTERLCQMHGMRKVNAPVYLHRTDK